MNRTIFLGLFILISGAFWSSCGGGGTKDEVCSAAANRLFSECDQTNEEDQQILWNALQGLGVSISFDEIATANESEVAAECTQSLQENEVEITDADAADFVSSLKDETTCQGVVNTIEAAVNDL